MILDIRILESLRDVSRDAWNACFANEPEDYDYLLATEQSTLDGFTMWYAVAFQGDTLCAAMPAFLTDYKLDTTLEGKSKKIVSGVRTIFPKALTLKLACLGSPVTETGNVGFHASVEENAKPLLLNALLEAFEQHARIQGCRLLGVKDMALKSSSPWHSSLAARGFGTINGLPVATLPIDFATMDEYFSSLSAATRKDMRRKLKSRDGLRIEHRSEITDMLPQMMELYRATRARAAMQLEDLNQEFFTLVLKTMQDRAFCTLYWSGDTLLAFNLLIKNETTLLDKFFCMDERGRDHNLYFVSWFTNVAYCIDYHLKFYQSGAAGYENKLRLGSQLTQTAMAFKHRNRIINHVLRLVSPFFAIDVINALQDVV